MNGENEMVDLDCTYQGSTHMMLAMTIICFAPHAIRHTNVLLAMLGVHIVGYFSYSLWHMWFFDEQLYDGVDIAIGCVILFVTTCFAIFEKRLAERKEWEMYRLNYEKHSKSKTLMRILDCLLPTHLVVPMLQNPGKVIATRIESASIIFIVVADFGARARQLPPDDLMSFLNELFSRFDEIFAAHFVTKIETIGEEYVAAVGVIPSDVSYGHKTILERIICAAVEILALQEEMHVKLRMGLHTGPVVAGVVGYKLPRFRLFGDTVNTAARMMQKGVDGELQFGESTRCELPDNVKINRRGEVEMKGKGRVMTYLLDWKNLESSTPLASGDHKHGDAQSCLADTVLDASSRQGRCPRQRSLTKTSLRLPKLRRLTRISNGAIRSYINRPAAKHSRDSAECRTASTDTQCTQKIAASFRSSKSVTVRLSDVMRQVSVPTSSPTEGEQSSCSEEIPLSGIVPAVKRAFRKAVGLEGQILTPECRNEWYLQFSQNNVPKYIGVHIQRQALAIVIITAVDAMLTILFGVFSEAHDLYGTRSLGVCVTSRVIVLLLLVLFRFVSSRSVRYLGTHQQVLYFRLLLLCVVEILLFVSYDALAPGPEPLSKDLDIDRLRKDLLQLPYRINLWCHMFTLTYLAMVINLRFPLFHATIFIVFSITFVSTISLTSSSAGWLNLHFNRSQLVVFWAIGCKGIIVARGNERRSQFRFQTTRAMDLTRTRTQHLLQDLLPPLVLKQLKQNPTVPPSHQYSRATIAQSDLVGFTALASSRKPEDVVEFVGELFGRFDKLTDRYDIYKVETVGDAYIAGQAERPLTKRNSPLQVLRFAIEMVQATREWAEHAGEAVSLRVGMHTGECKGGIIGADMQRYHLFGELMECLEALESTAPAGEVQLSMSCRDAVVRRLCGGGHGATSTVAALFKARTEPVLRTSKGEVVEYTACGGCPTFIVAQPDRILTLSSNEGERTLIEV